jgi:hypothetical protein
LLVIGTLELVGLFVEDLQLIFFRVFIGRGYNVARKQPSATQSNDPCEILSKHGNNKTATLKAVVACQERVVYYLNQPQTHAHKADQ